MAGIPLSIAKSPEGGHVYAGLDWRSLPNKGSDRDLRNYANEIKAKFAVRCVSAIDQIDGNGKATHKRVGAGFFTAIENPIGKKPNSIAAAFASWSANTGDSALCVDVDLGDKHATMTLVVVCISGIPVLDAVFKTRKEARVAISEFPGLTIFSDDPESYPKAITQDDLFGAIVGSCGKHSQLRQIPQNFVALALVVVIVGAAVFGYGQFKKQQVAKIRAAEMAKRAAEDPSPKYYAALAVERNKAGVTVESLDQALAAAMKLNLSASGWDVRKIECGVAQQGCNIQYTRTTGTFERLVREVSALKLIPRNDVTLNEATMSLLSPMTMAALTIDPPSLEEFVQKAPGSRFQEWITAGMNVQLKPPVLWPRVAGVPTNFKLPRAIMAGDAVVSSVGLPQLREVLASAPKNVMWNGFAIEFGQAGKGSEIAAKAKIYGVFYVKQ